MKVWLDDERPAPAGWEWAKTVRAAKLLLDTDEVTGLALDHDLGLCDDDGAFDPLEETGYDLCLWMAENDVWPHDGITIHSSSGVGTVNMSGVIERYGPYRKLDTRTFTA